VFWRKKKSSGPPIVGCFGKIPATGDFIRHQAGGDELAAFDRWLGGAMDHAQRSLGQEFEANYQRSVGLFMFRGEAKGDEGPERALVGAWAASGDSAGRLYPMVVFASYDYERLVSLGPAAPIALWRFLTSAYEVATQGRSWTVDQFLQRVARLEALKGQELPQTGLALRLPIGAGDAYATAVWLDLVLRLAGWKQTLPNTFWIPQQTVLIHLGPPHVGSLREIISPTGSAEHVAELCGLPTCDETTARARLKPGVDGVVANTDQPIAQFLSAIA